MMKLLSCRYNKPLEYAQMVLGGEIEHYSRLVAITADWRIHDIITNAGHHPLKKVMSGIHLDF